MKNLLRKIIPQSLLFRLEPALRRIYAIRYMGNTHACNICEHNFSDFIHTANHDLLCPYCGSLSRNRRLFQLIQSHLKGKVLDFSPSRCLYRKLKKRKDITYISTDFENEFIADRHYDITNIPEPDESFDLILCYHILEHIENDEKAMGELLRVLKKGGHAFIQTPFKEGDIYEDSSIKDPAQRRMHFGQEDHVRIYSVEGLKKRLEKAGFKVEVKQFQSDSHLGLSSDETVLILKK